MPPQMTIAPRTQVHAGRQRSVGFRADEGGQSLQVTAEDLLATPSGTPRRLVHGSPNAATVALVGLFIIALFAVLYVARAFVIPIVLAMHLALVLSPVVRALRRRLRLPGPLGAALVVLGLLTAVGAGFYLLAGPAGTWMERIPESFRVIEHRIRDLRKPVDVVRRAADEVEKIATDDPTSSPPPVVAMKRPSLVATLLSATHSAMAGIGLAVLALYFFLAWGNLSLRHLIRALPTLKNKKRAVEITRETEHQVSAYLLTITLINALVGAVLGCALWLLGVPNPALWGAMAFLLNFIPYLGPITGVVVLGVVALITFPGLGQALLVPGVYFLLHAVETNLITPLVLVRRLTLNPLVMFLWLSLWFWLWGVPGALLAVPMLKIVKIFCDNIPELARVGQFLGR
ncbi:MAG TPA: AI-2E family transporter [Candidatus Sulfotelmatobacter sp.]|nr:AI-2E family transporter [Candidatus Sulfotelmatobacter sp.]